MERPDDVAEVWRQALSSDRPVVIAAVVDPEVPPLPPHISYEQASSMLKSLIKGDPEARDVIKQSFKGKVEELVHRD